MTVMSLIKYENWKPNRASRVLVNQANGIIAEYAKQNLTLTLRQLYYQFVSRDLIENTERSYKNLGAIITKARMAGMLSWFAIEDRNRGHVSHWSNEDPDGLIKRLSNQIRFDQWSRQEQYVEVWVEKEALGNVVQRACDPLLVPYLSCKGYLSASEAWRAGQRLKRMAESGKQCTIIHLGDHDPSGIDMTRDNQVRLEMFSHYNNVTVDRIALNMNQIEEYQPPENPAKLSDSRAKEYINQYGNSSWELDALEPQVMIDLITETIEPMIDRDVWDETLAEQYKVEEKLDKLSNNWVEVQDFLDDIDEE